MPDNPRPGKGGFPPRLGWIPIGVALALVSVASIVSFVPQYASHQIIGVSSNGNGDGSTTDNSTGTQGTQGSQGHTVLSGGSSGTTTTGKSGAGANDCAHGKNAGRTDTGVSATSIHIATTDVTTGIGAGFLGQAVDGMKAAINAANHSGGICGRQINLASLNDGWDGPTGANDISGFINQDVFALVGEPDSEGLDAAVKAGMIDRAGIPVVGTDGMLASQYNDPWIWPVASSTVSNMHIAAQYAVKQLQAKRVGIVYDNVYKFGAEGAKAFVNEIQRLAGSTLGIDTSKQCSGGFCGIDPSSTDYSSPIHDFNVACSGGNKCDVVVMLLEPKPMETWMQEEENCQCSWYKTLMGGEPLFDDNFANNCGQSCAAMVVWTGYKPNIQPFDGESSVYTFAHALSAVCNTCDPHNEFTEGAYLGTQLFIAACQKVGSNLTRTALRQELDSDTFDLGLSTPLHYGTGLPHQANVSMTAYQDNASGSFNGWSYLSTGFLSDPAPGKDLQS